MRLTLRTLLAWLDDTLPPAEVREIGNQVSESPFAQELVDRIKRVTRQRRLTVPGDSGPEGVDPNLVASYLDNELDQDIVPEFEKICLTSDVHMAEVASVHQILSLIGQKAKVPDEARKRMYHLVRGRETVAPRPAGKPPVPAAPAAAPEPVGPWVTPPPPARPWYERYGPAAVAVLLIGVLAWSAWSSLSQEPQQTLYLAGPVTSKATPPDHVGKAAAQQQQQPKPAPIAPAPEAQAAAPQPASGAGANEAEAANAPEGEGPNAVATTREPANPAMPAEGNAPRPDVPAGGVGMAGKPAGVLLRFNPEQRQWERINEPTPLKSQDRLLSLDPFRSTLELGPARVDLVGETEVWLGTPPPSEAARLHLVQGRVVLAGASPSPLDVQFGGRSVLITPSPGSPVGVERISRFEPGNPAVTGSLLRVYNVQGETTVAVDNVKETLHGPGGIVWDGSRWTDSSDRPPPAWVTEREPSAYDAHVGEQFLGFFRPNRPVLADIVEAREDEQKDVRRLAIRALRAVGDLSFLVPVLSTPDDPIARREAIRVLRSALAQGPDAVKAVHDQLVRDLGEAQAAIVEKLLVGYTPKEARDEATYTTLVQQLTAPDVGVRELALDNLRTLTGRDDLEYDPDQPEGRGYRAWHDLLVGHELRPATP